MDVTAQQQAERDATIARLLLATGWLNIDGGGTKSSRKPWLWWVRCLTRPSLPSQ
ncbi:hypothetical protein ACP70R_043122 [Stipagrostis hirtigluma subsp. patula]